MCLLLLKLTFLFARKALLVRQRGVQPLDCAIPLPPCLLQAPLERRRGGLRLRQFIVQMVLLLCGRLRTLLRNLRCLLLRSQLLLGTLHGLGVLLFLLPEALHNLSPDVLLLLPARVANCPQRRLQLRLRVARGLRLALRRRLDGLFTLLRALRRLLCTRQLLLGASLHLGVIRDLPLQVPLRLGTLVILSPQPLPQRRFNVVRGPLLALQPLLEALLGGGRVAHRGPPAGPQQILGHSGLHRPAIQRMLLAYQVRMQLVGGLVRFSLFVAQLLLQLMYAGRL
mmetsp:Transcript_51573/g.156751  ORF Transcript_51573/g.156751 Transcript_51573/m.156751 type:complete len:283 (+) Transcript_51573:294-1142(+)